MKRKTISRREFFRRAGGLSAIAVSAGFVVTGCGSKEKTDAAEKTATDPLDCNDLSGVSEQDLSLRKKLAYVNESPINDNQCNNCNLYLPPMEGRNCGGCMLFKGPVEASGYCTYWAPKV